MIPSASDSRGKADVSSSSSQVPPGSNSLVRILHCHRPFPPVFQNIMRKTRIYRVEVQPLQRKAVEPERLEVLRTWLAESNVGPTTLAKIFNRSSARLGEPGSPGFGLWTSGRPVRWRKNYSPKAGEWLREFDPYFFLLQQMRANVSHTTGSFFPSLCITQS